MNFSKNIFFTPEECANILEFSMNNGEVFSYVDSELNSWDCRRIHNIGFKENIINKFINLYSSNDIKFWFDFNEFNLRNVNISLTRYYDGRFLELHKDVTSNYTTVISLTDNYFDGRFVLSEQFQGGVHVENNTKIALGIGEGITFEGNKTYHGVMPVSDGLRCALNIWMNDSDFEYRDSNKEKKLI